VAVENRLTADQLAVLAPGDTVAIESGTTAAGFQRPRLTVGRVIRVNPAEIVVSVKVPGGGNFVQRYSRRDGRRTSGGGGAELVDMDAVSPATVEQRREVQQLDRLWWAWRRNRGDVDTLRRLHDAIGDYLQETGPRRSR